MRNKLPHNNPHQGHTGSRTNSSKMTNSFLARSTLVVVRAGTGRRATDAFAFTALFANVTLVVVHTRT
ncbi:hypothetical protein pdam_00015648 [Pocillopora damicornis]|uniref:Uncharacterized protein n=1 Tax=Pocillopora damicornis TaxID=46731 RepID=A0A3M6UQU4_POCDA|nr:hypothetical protein pdam_00015648 [Pocillopora damicornis]